MSAHLLIDEIVTRIRGAGAPSGEHDVMLEIGSLDIARRYFRHEPPTAGEMEAAIEVVEDALMPAIPRLRGFGTLLTSDEKSLALASAAGFPAGAVAEFDLAAIESMFNHLVDVVNGRPATSEGLPSRNTFAANLLIVRELMHHADLRHLIVMPPEFPDDQQ